MKILNNLISQMNFAIQQRNSFFVCDKSKKTVTLLNLLLNEGFILGFYQFKTCKTKLCVYLKYWDNKPLIKQINLVSKSGSRVYVDFKKLSGDLQTNSNYILSTSLGGFVLINQNNIKKLNSFTKFGGELIAKIII